jgi:hypothetical protein
LPHDRIPYQSPESLNVPSRKRHTRGEKVSTHFEYDSNLKSQRLADLKSKAEELERELSDARVSLERELAQSAFPQDAAPNEIPEATGYDPAGAYYGRTADGISDGYEIPPPPGGYSDMESGGPEHSSDERTEVFVNHGRRNAYYPSLSRRRKIVAGTAALAAFGAAGLVTMLASGGASWPPSVATVQGETARACQNPDVKSEPGQVNFACAKATRQVLWVFALMTSSDNPDFADAKTGRVGLEPITPAQGGEMAWSLNLHHPYDPTNPIDSLEVAARAINNIIGGATLTGAYGNPVVQSGLESQPANCVRYTGSARVTARQGFPGLCASPVTSPAGQAALVADIYQKWVVGAPPKTAQDAAVLFQNADNPGDPAVQVILKNLPIQNR